MYIATTAGSSMASACPPSVTLRRVSRTGMPFAFARIALAVSTTALESPIASKKSIRHSSRSGRFGTIAATSSRMAAAVLPTSGVMMAGIAPSPSGLPFTVMGLVSITVGPRSVVELRPDRASAAADTMSF